MSKSGKNIGAIIAIIAVVIAFCGIVIWRIVDKNESQAKIDQYDVNAYIGATEDNGNIADHVKGDIEKAKVILFEYADFQCEACASHNPRVNKLVEEYNGDVAVVYRNFLLSYHQNGTAAASAAEAAGLQGYWKEYADKLFSNQATWSSASGETRTKIFADLFDSVTGGKGDREKFISDMSSSAVKKKINFDASLSEKVDIAGTPTFYLDGEKINFAGTQGEEGFLNAFREKIDAKLEK